MDGTAPHSIRAIHPASANALVLKAGLHILWKDSYQGTALKGHGFSRAASS